MADYFQNGVIANLHNLVDRPVDNLEAELKGSARSRRMAPVLPSLYSELEQPALEGMVSELRSVNYLKEVVVGLDRADRDQFEHAKAYFDRMGQPLKMLWS